MTRQDAFALAGDLADAGYSANVSIAVNARMTPREECSVSPIAIRFEHVALAELLTIGSTYGQELHLIGDQLSYFPSLERPA